MTTVEYFSRCLPVFLDELRLLVEMDSPTGDQSRAGRLAGRLSRTFSEFAAVEQEPIDGFGPLLRIRRPGTGAKVLLLAHYDTVWSPGEWEQAWIERDGKIYGPGVYDMKAGLLFVQYALRWLGETEREAPDLEILINPDEEVGSVVSRPHIEQAAAVADFALVMEPASPQGHLKLERKGSGEYVIEVKGRPAHQGVEPEAGINAIVEAAHQILAMLELEDLARGTTVGPNVITAGTVSNTVASAAEIAVDVRAWTRDEQRRLDRGLRQLAPRLEGAEITLRGGWNRPPMESTRASIELFRRTRQIGCDLGLDLHRVAWGGSSDANLAAAVGVPTMDGLGPVGDGAHQFSEHIVVDQLPVRMALFSELVTSLAVPPEDWLSPEALDDHHHRRRGND